MKNRCVLIIALVLYIRRGNLKLIFGGAYQGKLEYALKEYKASEDEIFYCSDEAAEIDLSKRIIYGLENFSWACEAGGSIPKEILLEILESQENDLNETIFISKDIFCGLVPMDIMERSWRENHGRMMIALANRCTSVERIFCGIPMKIK